mmetsp:Transcript_11956/g.19310  ORF Transcript_11956/g.19310 Transcript_11956/m.19310 type:complete len:96 (+) Transcript_11956:96-383(+)
MSPSREDITSSSAVITTSSSNTSCKSRGGSVTSNPDFGLSGGHVPIVALTANVSDDSRSQCLASGMDDYCVKPFKKADFATCLEKWCKKAPPPAL